MQDPGLDLHDRQSRYELLEPLLEDSPAEALPELGELVSEMLDDAGFSVEDAVAGDGVSPDVLAEYRSARGTQRRLERGEGVGPGDVAAAVNGCRAIYELLTTSRATEPADAELPEG